MGIAGRFDAVDTVAVRAGGGKLIAAGNGLAVDALDESVFYLSVASSAGSSHIGSGYGRMSIVGGNDFMSAMTVRAGGSFLRTVGHGAPVNALLVGEEGLRAHAVVFHQKFLPVAAAAGGGDVVVVYGRGAIRRREDNVHITVAILARSGRGLPRVADADVNTVRVSLLRGGVAGSAINGFQGGVGEGGRVGVAVDTGEHAAVDGMPEFGAIDIEADGLALDDGGGRWIGVAGKAGFVLDFWRGIRLCGPCNEQEDENGCTESAYSVHANTMNPCTRRLP